MNISISAQETTNGRPLKSQLGSQGLAGRKLKKKLLFVLNTAVLSVGSQHTHTHTHTQSEVHLALNNVSSGWMPHLIVFRDSFTAGSSLRRMERRRWFTFRAANPPQVVFSSGLFADWYVERCHCGFIFSEQKRLAAKQKEDAWEGKWLDRNDCLFLFVS